METQGANTLTGRCGLEASRPVLPAHEVL